jgi:hypothetical protein
LDPLATLDISENSVSWVVESSELSSIVSVGLLWLRVCKEVFRVDLVSFRGEQAMFRAEVDSFRAEVDSFRAEVDSFREERDVFRAEVDSFRVEVDSFRVHSILTAGSSPLK